MKKSKAFTLAEVLITLVIIGIVAAITVPSLLQSTQDKEYHSKLRKNISIIKQAFNLAQVNEGMMGDNTAIVNSVGIENSSDVVSGWGISLGLSKYINTNKICTRVSSTQLEKCNNTDIEELKQRWDGKNIPTYMCY